MSMASPNRFLGRIERFQVEHAHLRERRSLDLLDERGQVEVLTGRPGRVEQVGEQDVLPALDRVGVYAHQAQEARGRGADAVAQRFLVVADRRGGCSERLQDAHRQAGGRARGVDGEVGRVFQALRSVPASCPQSASPFFQVSACCWANSSGDTPFLLASSSLTQGRKSSARSSGKVSSSWPGRPWGR